jgi:hypothetical protein
MTIHGFPSCERCGGPEARTHFSGTPLCDACFNAEVVARTGWEALPPAPAPEDIARAGGSACRMRYRLWWAPSGGVVGEAEEADRPPGEGFAFQVTGQPGESAHQVVDRLREKVWREVGRAYLEREGGRWGIAGDEVAGRVSWREDDPELPTLVIDGQPVSWEELGRMLLAFEGWEFRLVLGDGD